MEEFSQHSRRYLNTVEGEPIIEAHPDGSETIYVRLPHLKIFPDDLIDLIAERHSSMNFGKSKPRPNTRQNLIWNRRQFLPSGILQCSGCGYPLSLNQNTYGCKSYSNGRECHDPNYVPHKSIDRVIVTAIKQALEGEWQGAGDKYRTFRLRFASKDSEKPEARRSDLEGELQAAKADLDQNIYAIGHMNDPKVIAVIEKRIAAILSDIEELEGELVALDEPAKVDLVKEGELKLMALREAFDWLEAKLPLRPAKKSTAAVFNTICGMVPNIRLERVLNRQFVAHVTIQPDAVFGQEDKDLTFELAIPFENDPVAHTSSKRTGERSKMAGKLMRERDYTFSVEEVAKLAKLPSIQRHYPAGSTESLARMLPCLFFAATNDFTFAEALIAAGIPKRTYLYTQAMSVRNDIDVQILLDAMQELRPTYRGKMHLYKREARTHLTPRQILKAVDHPVLKLAAFSRELRNDPVQPSIKTLDESLDFVLTGRSKKGRKRAYFIMQSFVTAVRMNLSIAEICGQHDNRCTPDLKAYMKQGKVDELVRHLAVAEGVFWGPDVPSLWETLYVRQGKDKSRQRAGVKKKVQG